MDSLLPKEDLTDESSVASTRQALKSQIRGIEVFKDFSARYFSRHRPVIIFEIHESIYRAEENLDFIKEILLKNHYYYRRDGSNLLCFPRAGDD